MLAAAGHEANHVVDVGWLTPLLASIEALVEAGGGVIEVR